MAPEKVPHLDFKPEIVSLVIPVMNESVNLPILWRRLKVVSADLPREMFEVVFVDDGSTDSTVADILALQAGCNLVWRLVELSRNFGQQIAVSAGMQYATGDVLVFLDADLQDPPEMIPALLAKYRQGYDVVYGIRTNRKEPMLLRFCFRAFYRLFNVIADLPIPSDAGDFGLMSRRVADLVVKMPERDRLIRGLRSWVGFRQAGIEYDRPARESGLSRYSFWRRLEGALDGLFGFSKLPIRLAFCFGVFVLAICSLYMATSYLIMFLTGDRGVIGWRSVITFAFILGAANLIATSIVGEYVCRIYFQAKQRPLFVVKNVEVSNNETK